jgi:hypothetical protein
MLGTSKTVGRGATASVDAITVLAGVETTDVDIVRFHQPAKQFLAETMETGIAPFRHGRDALLDI